MGAFALLLWLGEHWWLIALVAVIAAVGSALAGITSAAKILAELLRLVYAIAAFFIEPKGQIAGKVLTIIAALCIGLWIGHWHGARQVLAAWAAADKAALAATAKADADISAQADKIARAELEKSVAADKTNNEARNAYIAQLETKLASKCVVSPDSLRRLRALK